MPRTMEAYNMSVQQALAKWWAWLPLSAQGRQNVDRSLNIKYIVTVVTDLLIPIWQ